MQQEEKTPLLSLQPRCSMDWLLPWPGLEAEGHGEGMRGEREGWRKTEVPWRGVEPEPRWHQAASSVALQFQRWRVSLSQCLSPLWLDRRCHCRPPHSGSPMRLLPSAGQSGGLRRCPPHPQVCVVAPCPQSPSVSAREGRPCALIPGFGRRCRVATPRLEQLLSPGPELEADPGGCSSPSSLPADIM